MKTIFVLVAGFALGACGGEKAVKSGDTVVFMGDSITQYGKDRSHGYPRLVVKGLAANGIDVTWHGVGICGNTAGDMLARFDKDVLAKRPDVVTISAGVNDIYKKVAYEQFRADELEMARKSKAAGAKTVMLSPTAAGYSESDSDTLRQLALGVREIAAAEGLSYAPAYETFRAWVDDPGTPALQLMNGYAELRATCDSCHMAPAGDRQLARATLKGLGLDADELAKAEAAWNADGTLVPLVPYDGSASAITVKLTAAEAATVAGLSLKQILDRGIPSLAASPTPEAEASGASVTKTVDKTTGYFTFKAYDQLIIAARKLGIRVDQAVRCAILRAARNGTVPAPAAPVAGVNAVLVGPTYATFDATISSVGATASACDAILRCGKSAGNLATARRIAVGENASFRSACVEGLEPNAAYCYALTFRNNATPPQETTVTGRFTTRAASGAIRPNGDDDTATIQAAIDKAVSSKGTVTLDGGVFNLSAELTVPGGVTLRGQGMFQTVLRQRGVHRVATLKGGARLEDLTAEGGRLATSWDTGAGVQVEDGAVSSCRIWHNVNNARNGYGAGVFVVKGAIDHSVIAFNRSGGATSGAGGIGCYNKSGTVVVDTCLIHGNAVKDGSGGGVGFFMGGPNLTIRNTTIAGNSSGASGGGIRFQSGKLVLANCIVSGNAAAAGEANLDGATAAGSSNNLVGGSPAFADAANGDFHLSAGSPAIGAGTAYAGIGKDLDGVPFAAPPAQGCYEYAKQHVHVWGTPVYNWQRTATSCACTAVATCTGDDTHVKTAEATVAFAVTEMPTTERKGRGRYVATFADAGFATQTSGDFAVAVAPLNSAGAAAVGE